MDRFLQCVPALSNKDQNEVSAVITDSDTHSNVKANVVLEISLNNSLCEVERVIQDLGNELMICLLMIVDPVLLALTAILGLI